jgi:hypothetical protein
MSAQLKTTIKYPGSLIRPRFEPGALLLDEDLTAIVDHTRDLSRLLFRSLFGCGVICGFRVTAQVECGNLIVAVAPGVALDCKGDPIEMCGQQTLGMPCIERVLQDQLWVLIRRSARDHTCAPRDVACPSDDGGAYKPTRAKDCFELTLTKDEPEHACGCPELPTAAAPVLNSNNKSTADTGNVKSVTADPNSNPTFPERMETALPADWQCHIPHYCGVCSCGCCDSCGDGWVVLARVSTKAIPGKPETHDREVDYTVRRFLRPVIAADPLRFPERDTVCKRLLAANPDGS